MERDRRLTGFMRGQTDKPEAPAGFELNHPWRVSMAACANGVHGADVKQCESRFM